MAAVAFLVGVWCNDAAHLRRKKAKEKEERERIERNRVWVAIEGNQDRTNKLSTQVSVWMTQMDRISTRGRK